MIFNVFLFSLKGYSETLSSIKSQGIMRVFFRNKKRQFLCMGDKVVNSWLLLFMSSEGSDTNSVFFRRSCNANFYQSFLLSNFVIPHFIPFFFYEFDIHNEKKKNIQKNKLHTT